jgi:hypothetical protein
VPWERHSSSRRWVRQRSTPCIAPNRLPRRLARGPRCRPPPPPHTRTADGSPVSQPRAAAGQSARAHRSAARRSIARRRGGRSRPQAPGLGGRERRTAWRPPRGAGLHRLSGRPSRGGPSAARGRDVKRPGNRVPFRAATASARGDGCGAGPRRHQRRETGAVRDRDGISAGRRVRCGTATASARGNRVPFRAATPTARRNRVPLQRATPTARRNVNRPAAIDGRSAASAAQPAWWPLGGLRRAANRPTLDGPNRQAGSRGPYTTTSRPAGRLVRRNRRRPTLPGPCEPSTIGAVGLNCSVRNGKRCFPHAIATGNFARPGGPSKLHSLSKKRDINPSSPRPISTGLLRVSPHFQIRPINLVVYQGSYSFKRMGELISRPASRLDAFSGYPIRT